MKRGETSAQFLPGAKESSGKAPHFATKRFSRRRSSISAPDPERPGSMERPDLMIPGARIYHLVFSRNRVKGRTVKEPRHVLLYRRREDDAIEVARVVHDARDLARHLPKEYRRGGRPPQ
jgi:hypothetical protein